VALRVGDRLTLYTDGLPEARNASGELYGFERLKTLFDSSPDADRSVKRPLPSGRMTI
jgi:serine phosphatase RsbU (regulator of sigma subunit)